MIDAMAANGLDPFITVSHYEMPLALALEHGRSRPGESLLILTEDEATAEDVDHALRAALSGLDRPVTGVPALTDDATVLEPLLVRPLRRVAGEVRERFGGVAMIEPISGAPDYPVKTLIDAAPLLNHGGLLLDLYHLAVNDAVELEGVVPEHVQVADLPGRGAPGTGELPLEQWVAQLRANGYRIFGEEQVGELIEELKQIQA